MAKSLYLVNRFWYDSERGIFMRHKVETITRTLTEQLSAWPAVNAITLAEAANEELLSPYFFLSIDVFYRGLIPPLETRMASFSNPTAFESVNSGYKDRFLFQELPVRLEYKNMDRIEGFLNLQAEPGYALRETGTYMFYRIQNNKVLYQKSPWLADIQKRITSLPDTYWHPLALSCRAAMEHQVSDLAAAVLAEDDFFFLRSLSAFVNSICSLMFLINRRFEPSGRRMISQLFSLPELPENFKGRFECLIREDPDFNQDRKKEIALLLSQNISAMV